MELNLIRSLVTLALFTLFIVLIFQVYRKKNKHHFDSAANTIFNDGDERSVQIKQDKSEVNSNE